MVFYYLLLVNILFFIIKYFGFTSSYNFRFFSFRSKVNLFKFFYLKKKKNFFFKISYFLSFLFGFSFNVFLNLFFFKFKLVCKNNFPFFINYFDNLFFYRYNLFFIPIFFNRATFLFRIEFLKPLITLFKFIIYSTIFGWYVKFNLIGYNFTIKSFLRRGFLRLNLGYSRHKFILKSSKFVKFLTKKKRKISIFSNDFNQLFTIVRYIVQLRNVFPYKIRGFILFSSVPIVMKQGKKTKYR